MRIEKQISGAIGMSGTAQLRPSQQKQVQTNNDGLPQNEPSQYVAGMKPGGTGRLVQPELEQQLRARISELQNVLLAGMVTKKLERSIKNEIRRLERVLLAGIALPASATTALLAPGIERQIKARIKEIDRLFLVALLSPEGVAQLEAEKAALQRLLQSA